jgi:hypothetical protein
MIPIMMLELHAIPAYVPYEERVVPIDYDPSRGGLVVGKHENYVRKVADAARWQGLTSVSKSVEKHTLAIKCNSTGYTKKAYSIFSLK